MPLAQPVFDLFGSEWDRFTTSVRALDADSAEARKRAAKRAKQNPDGTIAVNAFGWSDIVHVGTPYQPTPDEFKTYYRAKAQKRTPDLPDYVSREIERRAINNKRAAQSAQPDYALAMGGILTAIDNVQDFLSTVATFGRLGLWGVQKGLQAVLPGATDAVARLAAQAAGRDAAAYAAANFAATIQARAAAGNAIARAALANPALYAAARNGAIKTAVETAERIAFQRALLGIGGRFAARFIPVIGWIVLASDLLNLLSLLGMMATPAYALLCHGPAQALAAGVPAAVMKRMLKAEAWTMHNLNPFSRKAVAARALKSAGSLPSWGNLLEVAQTTDQLFGVGLSLGGIVGTFNEIFFGALALSEGKSVQINPANPIPRLPPSQSEINARNDPATRRMVQQAGVIATTAPAIMRVQDVFDEETHLQTGLAWMQAIALLAHVYRERDGEDIADAMLDRRIAPPLAVSAGTRIWAEAEGIDLANYQRWWFDGAPTWTTGRAYVDAHAGAVPQAIRDFIAPRRAAPTGAMYGAIVNQGNDFVWHMLTRDPDFFRWELTTDARLISSLTESGWLLSPVHSESAVWKFWNDARRDLEAANATSLTPDHWKRLADRNGVDLIRMLHPLAPVPPSWSPTIGPGLA